jgi:hypothetical protein
MAKLTINGEFLDQLIIHHIFHKRLPSGCPCSPQVRESPFPWTLPEDLYDLDNPEDPRYLEWLDEIYDSYPKMVGKKSGKALLREEGTR